MPGTPAVSGRLRLMLIDDHDGARAALVRRFAEHARVEIVATAANLTAALALAHDRLPHAALIDTPRDDRQALQIVAALADIVADRRPLVAVYLSFFDAEHWLRAQTAGAREWVLKGFDLEATTRRLGDAVKRELPEDRWPGAG